MGAVPFFYQPTNGFEGSSQTFNLQFADAGAGIVSTVEQFGATPTFTRATSSWTNLSTGNLGLVASGSPRSYYSPAGVYLGYLAEGARTNLCQRGEDFAAVWAAVGTPTLVATSTTIGALTLSTVGDDSAAALEGYTQTITFTGDAVKAVAIYVKKGTATSSIIRLNDTTAVADRLLAAITWSGTVPVVTMTTGTDLTGTPAQQGSSGVYRLLFATTAVTAANTNSLQLYPATDAALSVANTGTIEWGGVQAEDATFSSSLIRTPASATVTRNADVLTYPITGWLNALAGTMFGSGQALGAGAVAQGLFTLNDGGGNNLIDYRPITGAASNSFIFTGGAGQANIAGTAWTTNVTHKAAVAWSLNDIAVGQDGAINGTDTSATIPTVTTLAIGQAASGGNQLFGPISSINYIPIRLSNGALVRMTT